MPDGYNRGSEVRVTQIDLKKTLKLQPKFFSQHKPMLEPVHRSCNSVLYRVSDIDEWLYSCRRISLDGGRPDDRVYPFIPFTIEDAYDWVHGNAVHIEAARFFPGDDTFGSSWGREKRHSRYKHYGPPFYHVAEQVHIYRKTELRIWAELNPAGRPRRKRF